MGGFIDTTLAGAQQLADTNTTTTSPISNFTQSTNPWWTGTTTAGITPLRPKAPPTYRDLPDTPEIEIKFLSKEDREAIVWTPAVGRMVVFGSKNGVSRTGKVTGVSVLKPSIRHVVCEVGNPVFVDFADTDWYYEGTAHE